MLTLAVQWLKATPLKTIFGPSSASAGGRKILALNLPTARQNGSYHIWHNGKMVFMPFYSSERLSQALHNYYTKIWIISQNGNFDKCFWRYSPKKAVENRHSCTIDNSLFHNVGCVWIFLVCAVYPAWHKPGVICVVIHLFWQFCYQCTNKVGSHRNKWEWLKNAHCYEISWNEDGTPQHIIIMWYQIFQ